MSIDWYMDPHYLMVRRTDASSVLVVIDHESILWQRMPATPPLVRVWWIPPDIWTIQ